MEGSTVKAKGIRKLQLQYFASYLAVMLIVMVGLLIFAYRSFYSFHSRLLLESYENSLRLVREVNESTVENIISLSSQMTTTGSVLPFDFREEPEKANRLMNALSGYRATNDAIEEIFVYFYGGDTVYSGNSTYLTERFFDQAALFDGIGSDELRALFDNTAQIMVYPAQTLSGYVISNASAGTRVIPVLVPLSYSRGIRYGTVMYLLKQSTFLSWFAAMSSPEADVYIIRNDQPLVSQQGSGIPFETIAERISKSHADYDQTLSWDGQKYHLVQLPGQNAAYSYAMLISDKEVSVAMSGSIRMMTLVAAVVAALCLVFITGAVQSRMKPIRVLYEMLSAREPDGNELVEIRDGVQRLIDENLAMSAKMQDTLTLQKANFAWRFLVGDFADENEYYSQAEESRVNVDMRYYAVGVLVKPATERYELTADKLNHLFGDQVSGVARPLGVTGRMVMIAFADDEQMLMAFFENKLAGMRAMCSGITLAVSGVHSDYREGQRAYLEADNAFELRFVKGNAQIIRFDALREYGEEKTPYSTQAVDRLQQALQAADAGRVLTALRDISTTMSQMNLSLFGFRCMYNDILNVISAEARKSGVGYEEVYDLFQLSECLSLEDLDNMLKEVCSRLLKKRVSERKVDAPDAINEAREIIDKRFSEPGLSISSIAEQVGLSDSKLSVEFKRVYRSTPLEYITAKRMRCACRLLKTTQMPVKDIAIECGYYDISSFNRRFKAYTNMAPQQYRAEGGDMDDLAGE